MDSRMDNLMDNLMDIPKLVMPKSLRKMAKSWILPLKMVDLSIANCSSLPEGTAVEWDGLWVVLWYIQWDDGFRYGKLGAFPEHIGDQFRTQR